MGGAVCVSSVSTIMFTAEVFGKRASRRWWLLLLAWVFAAIPAHGPFRSTRYLSPITVSASLLAGGYSL